MKVSHGIKSALFGALVGGVVGWGGGLAYASTVFANPGYIGPINGINYVNNTSIENSPDRQVSTIIGKNGSGTVPTTWMGARARSFKNSNDTLCNQGNWGYNASPAATFAKAAGVGASGCGVGYYYSYGVTQEYNGNGYNSHFTYKSPVLNFN